MPPINPNPLSWKERISYGSGDFAINLYWQGVGFFLFFYLTDIIGLPNKTAGLVFMIAGLWDAISDPLMGYIAERTKTSRGTYRPYLLYGSLPLSLSGVLLFSPPFMSDPTLKAINVLVLLLIFRTCYTIVSIPYSALGARLTTNSRERTRLSGTRMYCGFLGGLTISAVAAGLRAKLPDAVAFQWLGITVGILAMAILYYCYRNTREIGLEGPGSKPATNLSEIVTSLVANRPLLLLLAGLIFVTICNTVWMKNLLYYFEYVLGSEAAGATAFFMITGTPLISIPFWSALAVRIGKRRSWVAAGFVVMAGFVALYLDQTRSVGLALAEVGLVTWGLSAYAVLLWSMLPDTIDFGERHTGVRNESVTIGVISSAQKASIAASAFFIGYLLDAVGYTAGQTQTEQTLSGLKDMITMLPFAAILLATIALYFYPLSTRRPGQSRTAEATGATDK